MSQRGYPTMTTPRRNLCSSFVAHDGADVVRGKRQPALPTSETPMPHANGADLIPTLKMPHQRVYPQQIDHLQTSEQKNEHPRNDPRTQGIAKPEKDIFDRVNAVKSERIKYPRTVVHFVKPPQKGYAMEETVEPIAGKIAHQKQRQRIENHRTLITQFALDILQMRRQS